MASNLEKLLDAWGAKIQRRGDELSELRDSAIKYFSGQPKPPSSGVSETARQLRQPNRGTGSPVIRPEGPRRYNPDLPKVVRDTLEAGREKLGEPEFPSQTIALRRQAIKKPVTLPDGRRVLVEDTAMGEFEGADTPSPFGRFRPVTDPGQSEFTDFDSPVPISSGRLPGSNENEELDADNTALSLLQDLPANPAARAANQVTANVGKGLSYGTQLAKAQNQEGLISQAADTISGLLGNVDYEGLFRVIARPEFVAPMGPGQSPLTNFINAAAADRTSQAALRAARQEAGLEGFKAETDRLKALMPDPSKMPKLTAEVNKMYDRIESSRRISEIGSKIKEALTANPFSTTGGPGETSKAFRGMAAMLGISPDTFDTDDVQKNIAKLKAEVLKSKTFGREASRQELEQILNKILAEPGLFTTSTQILDSVDSMMRGAERDIYNTTARMKAFGIPTSTDANPMSMPERYFTRNNQKAN